MLDPAVLISIDEQFSSPIAITNCIGDSFLCQNNQVFARIRRLFLEYGYCFVDDTDARARDYFSAPLIGLDSLLEQGLVPYRSNCGIVKYMVLRNPTFKADASFLLSVLAHNYVMHESAHLVASHVLSEHSGAPATDKREMVLRSLLGESFANAVEALSLGFACSSHMHRFCLCLNSYVLYDGRLPSEERLLSELFANFGFLPMFRMVLLAFLHSNIHDLPPQNEVIDAWIDAALFERKLLPSDVCLLRLVMSSRFRLSPGFRRGTTPHFFRLADCGREYEAFRSLSIGGDDLRSLDLMSRVNRLASCW